MTLRRSNFFKKTFQENILLRIHVHIANQESEDMCSNVNCIPHQKFAMTLVEQVITFYFIFTNNRFKFTNECVIYILFWENYLIANYIFFFFFSAYASLVERDPTLFLLHRWCTMSQHLLYGN